ncbi:class II aldolase [Romboutsia weinsteinii]|uniref:Class II aldolase n=1 Tax=Romboutsia weinsteinii TaxID=2020949 RepID=A0A371J5P6_9FIRM|nr:class II fructose-bisphosphate aldolase [Romboutsia weinsteinii]RDY28075.1 class II aldolase [Romboutsia weinsteinii]
MALVNMKKLLHDAKQGEYAVGAFNMANMETVMGAIKAAEDLNSPIILQIAEARLNYSPIELIGPIMIEAAKNSRVDVAVNFDHGLTLENIKKALDLGFTSVMIDGSKLPLEENIDLTKKVIEEAKRNGASVEAEVGRVGGSEDGSENINIAYTELEDARKFVDDTDVNFLAVAIGNAHGVYSGEPNLNFEVLKNISKEIEKPLVLHGGTGISEEDFRKSVKYGISKINIATSTFNSVSDSVKETYNNNNNINYFDISSAQAVGAYNNVYKHIKVFQSENKC